MNISLITSRQKGLFVLAVLTSFFFQSNIIKADSIPIRLHPANPHYFEFRGEPTVLVTSAEHYGAVINLDFDYIEYLDELEDKGLNFTRIFTGSYVRPEGYPVSMPTGSPLSPAPGRFIAPWARSTVDGYINGGNKFDLNNWDTAYFTRLTDFVEKAGERGIVVEVTMFCVYYDETRWTYSPMHIGNNINGVGNITREKVLTLQNGNLQTVQDSMTAKIVRELKDYDNVFYEIANEPYHPDADYPSDDDPELSQDYVHMDWQRRIAVIIDSTEYGYPHKHIIAQNIDRYYTTITENAGKLTDRIDEASLFNFHYTGRKDTYITNVYEVNEHLDKAIGCDETGLVEGQTEDEDYRKQAWKLITSGSALYNNLDMTFQTDYPDGDQSTPSNWYGGGPTLRTQLGILLDFIHGFNLADMSPNNYLPDQGGIVKQLSPSSVKVRCLANEGEEYALYFEGGSQVHILINLPSGEYVADWVNTKTGIVDKTEPFSHNGGDKVLSSPTYTENDIALRITGNQAPVVDAGTDQSITLPINTVILDGTVSDDGLPVGGSLTISWSKVSGPGTVTFDDPSMEDATATFSAAGIYEMELSAGDTELTSRDTVLITVINSITPELVAHWKLDENSGVTAFDDTEKANSGTLHDGPQWVGGQMNGGLSFDGTDDYVEIPHVNEYLVDNGTVSLWFWVEEFSSVQGLLSKDSYGFDDGGHMAIYVDANGTISAGLQSTNTSYYVSSGSVTSGEWHHLGFTFGSGGLKLYIDGDLEASNTSVTIGLGITSGGSGNEEPIALGALTLNSGDLQVTPLDFFLSGKLDEVRIYNYELDETEIEDIMLPENIAPSTDAGSDQEITLPNNSLNLNGTVNDDGLPVAGTLSVMWNKISGPGTVTFSDSSDEDATASFSVAGTYELELSADDSELSSSDTIVVNVVNNLVPELISHWKLDEGSGNTAFDETDNANDGTLNNNPQWVGGQMSGALSFDGTDDYVEIPHIDDYLLDNGTIAFWFWVDELNSYQGLLSKDSYGFDNGGHMAIFVDGAGILKAGLQSTNTSYFVSSDPVSTGEWHHLGFTFGSDGLQLYIDGIHESSNNSVTIGLGSTSGGSGNEEPIALGALTLNSGDLQITPLDFFLNGKLDDVRIYNYALDASEIGTIMIPENTAPIADAGADDEITLPINTINLNGSVADDGLPAEYTLTTLWTKVSGPGIVTFSNAGSLNGTATFDQDGTYILALTADDGELTHSDSITVVVNPSLGGDNDEIAYWKLDETSGITAFDTTIEANDGTLHNGPVWTSGQQGGALSFDGNNDYVEIPHIDEYLLDNGSIAFWFWTNEISGYQGLFSKDSDGYDDGGHVAMFIGSGGKVVAGLQSTSSTHLVQSNVITANAWHHVAFTFGDNGMKLYIDGNLEGTNSYAYGMGTSPGGGGNYEPIALGALTSSSGDLTVTPLSHYFDGKLDDVRLFDYALSQADITNLITAPMFFGGGDERELTGINSTEPSQKFTTNNYPNPFKTTTTIDFTVEQSNQTSLVVYNTIGEKIAVLFDGFAQSGNQYSFTFDGSGVPEGMYYYHIRSGHQHSEIRKMILLK